MQKSIPPFTGNQIRLQVYLQLHVTFRHRDLFKDVVIHAILTSRKKSSEASKMTQVPLNRVNDKHIVMPMPG